MHLKMHTNSERYKFLSINYEVILSKSKCHLMNFIIKPKWMLPRGIFCTTSRCATVAHCVNTNKLISQASSGIISEAQSALFLLIIHAITTAQQVIYILPTQFWSSKWVLCKFRQTDYVPLMIHTENETNLVL